MRLTHMGLSTYDVGEAVRPGIRADDRLVIGSGSGATADRWVTASRTHPTPWLRIEFNFHTSVVEQCRVLERGLIESWLRESGQVGKWIFYLTTATLAEDQEIR